jgi:protein gp37
MYLKKPSIIGCAFMGDLFGDWVDPEEKIEALMPSGKASVSMSLKGWILATIKQCPQHRFVFLTKNPKNLVKWSPFPDNCWVGVTATNNNAYQDGVGYLNLIEATIKYISFEPLLGRIALDHPAWDISRQDINWIIIGAQTKPIVMPKIEWVREIVEAADKAGIPVFLKDNFKPVLHQTTIDDKWAYNPKDDWAEKGLWRQEMPTTHN